MHCAFADNLGYAAVAALKKELSTDGYVLLADAGDAIQGAPIGTVSTGSYAIDLMNYVGYDVATPGNHEFDYGMERFSRNWQKQPTSPFSPPILPICRAASLCSIPMS